MSLFELVCSTWELIISRKIHNYCDQQNCMFQLRKQGCSMWSFYRHLKGVLTTPLRPLRPLKNPHWMTELYWSGLGNWVNQFLGQFVQYKDLNGTWFTPFPNPLLINKVQSHSRGGGVQGVLGVFVFNTRDILMLVGNRVKPLLSRHLRDLSKCLLDRGCPLNGSCKNCAMLMLTINI